MKTWKVESQGESWTVDAPDDVTEAEVNAFAAANYASWMNGGRYRMDPVGDDIPKVGTEEPKLGTPPADATPTKEDYDAAVGAIDRQLADLNKQRLAQGGPGNQLGGRTLTPDPALDAKIKELTDLRKQFAIGGAGQFVGGVGGALTGAAVGAGAGSLLAPGPGTAIGALLGSIVGGAAGTAAGTHLWDIPQAKETREVTDQEAAELIKQRAIESLIWDGAFTLILGPGGRVIGKMTKGAKFLPALKAAAKESMAWDDIVRVRDQQLLDKVRVRAEKAPRGISTQVSKAIDAPTLKTDIEATEDTLIQMAQRSGGRLPTKGEMSGLIEGGEAFARRQAPAPFAANDKLLAETAADIRRTALDSLDQAGAYTGPELGVAVKGAVESAETTLKRVTGPVFTRARGQDLTGDMTQVIKIIDDVVARFDRAAGKLGGITPTEIDALRQLKTRLTASGTNRMWLDGLHDMVSGLKADARAVTAEGGPSRFYKTVLGDLERTADAAFLGALKGAEDKTLVNELLKVRKLYRETLSDLYEDSLVKLVDKRPEAYGAALTAKGHVTEIRELRAALDRAAAQAPQRPRATGKGAERVVTEQSKNALKKERQRIDAGMIKGFIEKHTQSLENLDKKLLDPDFKLTLKELLTGKGVADPALGARVLEDLNRVVSVIKLASPEMAPQPGRLGAGMGVGSVGAGTTAAAVTQQKIQAAVPLVYMTFFISRLLGKIAATAMTTGNAGMLNTAARAVSLARLGGKNAAAAEAARAAFAELEKWDKETGGE